MRSSTQAILFASVLFAHGAEAACYADYKAKREGGSLQLHYGVISLPDDACDRLRRAEREIGRRIAREGWTLLNVVSLFDEAGLEQRRRSAAEYFLRF